MTTVADPQQGLPLLFGVPTGHAENGCTAGNVQPKNAWTQPTVTQVFYTLRKAEARCISCRGKSILIRKKVKKTHTKPGVFTCKPGVERLKRNAFFVAFPGSL